MITQNIRDAYAIMRGDLDVEDVPPSRQTWLRWFVATHGPARPIRDDKELGIWLLSRARR